MEPTPLSRDWGQRLREHRLSKGLSPSAFAKACGLAGRQTIHSYEAGRRLPDDSTRVVLARALGMKAADLFPYPDAEDAA